MDFTQKSASRYILSTLAVLIVITALALVALNAWMGKNILLPSGQGYADGYLAARKVYSNLCPMLSSTQQVTGIVQSNNGKELGILQVSLDTDPQVDGVSNNRIVTIDANTAIQKNTPKTPAELAAAFKANANSTTTLPVAMTVTTLKISDIQIGDVILVSSAQDVRLLLTIPATSVKVITQP